MNAPTKNEILVTKLEGLIRGLNNQASGPLLQVSPVALELAADATITEGGKSVAQRFNDAAKALQETIAPILEAASLQTVQTEAAKSPVPATFQPGPPVPRHIPICPALDRSKH